MKKLLPILLIGLCKPVFAVAVAAHVAASSAAIGAAHASQAAAQHQAQLRQQQVANQVARQNSDTNIKGVMMCSAYEVVTPSFTRIMEGCKIDNGKVFGYDQLSIHDYFMRFKPSSANEVVMIIYNQGDFEIYYK